MEQEHLLPKQSYFVQIRNRFLKHKLGVIGFFVMILIVLMAVFAPFIAPYDPNAIGAQFSAAPSGDHWFGTDQVGRDVFSRVVYASRVSLMVGLVSVSISVVLGVVLGLVSGYFGGWIDMVIMRITDVVMAFPSTMLILVIASIVGPGLVNIILILGFLGWPSVARLVRGNVLAIKEEDYTKAAVALGMSPGRILFTQVLPNTVAPILVYAT